MLHWVCIVFPTTGNSPEAQNEHPLVKREMLPEELNTNLDTVGDATDQETQTMNEDGFDEEEENDDTLDDSDEESIQDTETENETDEIPDAFDNSVDDESENHKEVDSSNMSEGSDQEESEGATKETNESEEEEPLNGGLDGISGDDIKPMQDTNEAVGEKEGTESLEKSKVDQSSSDETKGTSQSNADGEMKGNDIMSGEDIEPLNDNTDSVNENTENEELETNKGSTDIQNNDLPHNPETENVEASKEASNQENDQKSREESDDSDESIDESADDLPPTNQEKSNESNDDVDSTESKSENENEEVKNSEESTDESLTEKADDGKEGTVNLDEWENVTPEDETVNATSSTTTSGYALPLGIMGAAVGLFVYSKKRKEDRSFSTLEEGIHIE